MSAEPDRSDMTDGPATRRPAAMCLGAGHVIVYANPAFRAAFGAGCVGIPAREGLVDFPRAGLVVLDAVLEKGRPLARWIRWRGGEWRLTVAPRRDFETNQTYGVSMHLRDRADELELAGE